VRGGLVSRAVDRLLHTVALPPPYEVRPDVLAFHRSVPVVDLLVGSVLFRRGFIARRRHGHVDLPRLLEGGVDLVGLSIATRFPDRRGSLSRIHFRSLGVPTAALSSDMAPVEHFVDRIRGWARASGGRLRVVSGGADVGAAGGGVRAFVGVQGAHVLEGEPRNVERLHALGVRMLALAHVMDNEVIGSGTGRGAGGLSGLGREVVAECERVGIVVDLAHASVAGIRDVLRVARRPPVVSHTGFTALAGGASRWRRYSPATRNLPDEVVRDVADAGGLIGVTLSTQLLGGSSVESVVRAFAHGCEVAGPERVAIGSDFDGALRMPWDATGMPLLTQGLLDAGFGQEVVAGILGGNALRALSAGWVPEDAGTVATARASHTA
jgi:microsomal dipeptidase-like Zn-dependent dipeptidase